MKVERNTGIGQPGRGQWGAVSRTIQFRTMRRFCGAGGDDPALKNKHLVATGRFAVGPGLLLDAEEGASVRGQFDVQHFRFGDALVVPDVVNGV